MDLPIILNLKINDSEYEALKSVLNYVDMAGGNAEHINVMLMILAQAELAKNLRDHQLKHAHGDAKWEGIKCKTCRHTNNAHSGKIGLCSYVDCVCMKFEDSGEMM